MNLKEIFKHWLDLSINNIKRRNFNEIQEEYSNELEFARLNHFDPLDWCKGCQLGICETHFNPDLEFFIHDDSYGIEN